MRALALRLSPLTLVLVLTACGDDATADGSGSGDSTGIEGTGSTMGTTTAAPTTSSTTSVDTTSSTTDSTTGSDSSSGGELGEGCIVHVDAATGNDASWGGSWLGAVRTLQTGLALAAEHDCDVWIAVGTYQPSKVDDPSESFVLFPGVQVYGGFAGNETSLDERDWVANVTVLSGDLGVPGDIADDSAHVVTGADGARLDGVTVTHGHARADLGDPAGGGLYLIGDASMEVAHCRFEANRAGEGLGLIGDIGGTGGSGGAIYAIGNLLVDDCAFVGNAAGNGIYGPNIGGIGGAGGAIFISGSLQVYGATFTDNLAGTAGPGGNLGGPGGSGGAISGSALQGVIVVHDSTFTSNVAGVGGFGDNIGGPGGWGGAISAGGMQLEVRRSTFIGNIGGAGGGGTNIGGGAAGGGGIYGYVTDGLLIEGCLFQGNSAASGGAAPTPGGAGAGGGAYVQGNGPGPMLVAHNRFVDNDAGSTADYGIGGGLAIAPIYAMAPQDEIVVMGNTFVGNIASVGGGLWMRSKGLAEQHVVSCTFTGNEANIGGALVLQNQQPEGMVNPTLSDSILWGNTADSWPSIWANQGFAGDPYVSLEVSSTDIQGGCIETMTQALLCGAGNLDVDPGFVNVPAGDLHLQPGSAVQDQGDDAALPADSLDLDADGDALEPWSLDLDGNPRSAGLAVDMGAYELP